MVASYDLLSVTLSYSAAGATMTAPLVFGMPYVSVDYAGLHASAPLTFDWTRTSMTAAATFSGTLRLANLPGSMGPTAIRCPTTPPGAAW